MIIWFWSAVIVAAILAVSFSLRSLGLALRRRELWERDQRRAREQWRWIETGEIERMTRYVTDYDMDEMADEDAARMAELGFVVADEVFSTDGRRRRVVYRKEGALVAW